MSMLLKKIAQLQLTLSELEEDVGISDISTIEKRVLLAIADLTENQSKATTGEIMEHRLIDGFSRPSFYRALKSLEQKGKIDKSMSLRGFYSLAIE